VASFKSSCFAGFSQQMMPPPMGPNHMNYGPGGKMPPNNMSGPMGNYPPYNSQYQQGEKQIKIQTSALRKVFINRTLNIHLCKLEF
jgi:hypothetical protein